MTEGLRASMSVWRLACVHDKRSAGVGGWAIVCVGGGGGWAGRCRGGGGATQVPPVRAVRAAMGEPGQLALTASRPGQRLRFWHEN